MMKVKDGYKKLIGTSYSGSANNLLLSNGGDIPLTSLFTALTNDNNLISITVGGTNKKLAVAYATKASLDADGNVITSTYATKNELNATKYWANVPISATASNTTKPTLHPDFAFNVAANTIIAGGIDKAIASPLAKYLWHDILSFGVNSWPTVYVSSDGGSTWSTSTDINLLKKLFILRDDQAVTVLDNTKTAIRWVWNNSQFHACQAAYLNIGFAYSASLAKFNIVWDVSADGTTWSTGFSTNNVGYSSAPYWFYVNNTWSNIKYARLTLTRTSAAGTSANLSAIKLLSYRWGNQGRGGEYEYPYNWDASQNIYPRVSNASSLGLASNKWSNVYATTFTGDLEGNAKTATSANSAKSDAAGKEISTTYAPLASPTFTGTPSAPTAAAGTNTTQIATTAFVNNAVGAGFAANDAMLFKGTIGTGGTVTALPNKHSIGWTYRVITAGTYAGQSCEIGDLIICIADGTAANNNHWTVAQGNISNMSTVVAGPSSATSGNIAVFDGTTGKKIKDGGAKISDFLTKTTYEWNKEIAFGSTGKLCIGKFVMYDSAVIVTISATTNLTYHGVLVIATLNHGTASGGSIKATVYGDASNTIAPNIYIYSHPANDGLVEVYFNPTAYSKNLVHIQAQSLAQRGTVSYANLAFDICTSVTAIPAAATLKPTNALTETFMGKSGVSVSNLLTSGSKIGTITINGTAKDIYQTSLTWDNIANKPTSFTPSTHTHDYAPYQSWTASVKGVTWSRLCYVKVGNSTVGSKFILNIAATRNSVVYNDTYIITAHHSQNGKIAKIGGCNYSYGYQIRINTDSTGNCYVELYDNCNSATTATSLIVYCRLLSLFTGDVTKYTSFTDGTTLANGFKTVTTLTTTNEDFQGTVSASRLTTTSKTAWGLTYWTSNGVPTSISGNMTGVGSISMSDALTLTGTTAETAQVKFSRTSYNYITFPSTGYLALATAANGSSIVAAVDSSSISPYENNKGSLGKVDKVWNAVYATTFVGNVSGNVSGSAGSVAWGNVTGKPSSFTPSSHTHYSLATEGDKRNDNTTPDLYKNSLIFRGLKYSNKINSPASSTYSYLVGLRGWSDKSGGGAHELAFNDVGIQRRNSTSTSDAWGTWKTLLDSENFTTFVTTDAIGAAPSEHSHAYLPLTGGTVTGPIEFNTGTLNNNYNEGVRITAAANNWAGITFGSTGLAGAPTNGWFAAKNPSGQFIITPDNSSNTTGLTLNKNGDALWRNNKIYHAGNLTALKNPSALTIFNNNYDGSSAVTVNTISVDVLTLGYLNIHPENSAIIIPFINNDLAFLNKKGGSYKIYKTTSTSFTANALTEVSTSVSGGDNMFDGSPSYTMLTESGEFTAVIDLSLHKLFQYSNLFYIDFGSHGWRAKNISVYVKNADNETNYTSRGSVTNHTKGNWYCSVAHSSKSGGTTVQGFNRLRIVLSGFATNNSTSGKRIALVGLINYGSEGVKETFISRGGCNGIYGSLLPHSNNSLDLGSSSKKWANVYATTFSGTATKATADKDGVAFQGNYLRKITAPNNAANDFNNFGNMTLTGRGDPTTGASLSNAPWTGAGPAGGYGVLTYLWSGYGTQMAWGYNSNRIYIRNKYYTTNNGGWATTWDSLALMSDIPTSLPASDVYDWAKAATKPSYAFSEITPGNATIGDGTNSINLRTSSSWASSIYHHTTADEAVVFLNKGKEVSGTANYTTSWIFAYGTPSERPAWNTLTPALQIKGACVAINKLIGSKTAGAYNLDVNGTANAGELYENGVRVSVNGHTHAYLPTAGGTMTGAITMNTNTGIAMKYTSNGNDVWMYPNGAPTYGIRYFEGNPDAMAFSATGNNSTKTGADLCINGNGDGTVTIRGKNIWHAGNSGQVKWCDFWSTNSTAVSTNNISGATITTNCNDMVENGHWYYQSNGPTTTLGATTNDGALYSQGYNASWVAQIAQDYRNGNLFTRGRNSGTWTAWKKVAYINDIPTKVSQLTNDSGFVTGGPYLPLSGGALNDSATLKLQLWGARSLTLSGNSIDLDMSLDTGTYAGAFATIKDSKLAVTTMLGFYGSHSNGLYHIFMGGTYDNPAMKMDPSGNFTFKNTISGTITNANAAGTALRLTSPYAYEDNSLLNVITNNTTADSLFSDSYSFSAMMSNHPTWNNYATVWNFSGYTKYGGTQFAVMYNTQPVRAAIRTFTQTGSKWGDWVELLTTANFTNHITLAGLGIETWATNKGFATESYVTNKVAEIITGGTVKLDGYATEEYVNNTFLPKANLSVSGGGSTWQSSLTITLNGTATTLTLPANPNTDANVLLVITTTSNTSWRPLLLGASYSDSTPSTFSTTTSNIYASHVMRVQPSTGSLETSGTITASSFIGTATHATNAFYIKTQLQANTNFYAGYRAWFKWIDGSTLGLKIAKNNTETDTTVSTYKFKADAAYSADTAAWADGATGADIAVADQYGNVIDTTYLKLSGGTLTGGVTMSMANTSDVMYYANATNKGYKIGFGVGTSGNRGIYDAQAGGWVLKIDSSHKATFSGTAACADKINVTATDFDESFYIPFVDALSGSRVVNVNSGLSYAPASNTITATTFNGDLNGTSKYVKVYTKSDSKNYPILFAGGIGSSSGITRGIYTDSANSLYYNPNSNVLTSSRFASTVATGTAPMAISSTTVVTNLNADMVDGKHASDFAIPVGTIMMWAGSTAPKGWLLCNGAAVSRTTYSALFAVISTTYGTGNGSTTFNVPNLVQRFPLGADTQGLIGLDSSRNGYDTTLGKSGGSATHTLTVSELPSHRHSFTALRDTTRVSGKGADVNNTLGIQPSSGYTGYSGLNYAHNNIPPFLAVNFIIKY